MNMPSNALRDILADLAESNPALTYTGEDDRLPAHVRSVWVRHNRDGVHGPEGQGHYEITLYDDDHGPHWVFAAQTKGVANAAARVIARATSAMLEPAT